ncbi:MAG: SGNH/GDSL hydrolase family protein [Patescibacteria group bacterium]
MGIIILVLAVLAIISGVYLNRAYAFIYSKFRLVQPPAVRDYLTEKTLSEKSQLITYVALGDSLTSGVGASSVSSTLPALLAEKISAEKGLMVAVKNLGAPGATSFELLTGQVLDAARYNPEIITLFIGTNDLHNFVPLEKFKGNLLAAIGALQHSTQADIYLINLPYLGAKDLVLSPYDLYFEWELKKYNAAVSEAAQATGVRLIDLYSISEQPLKADSNLYCSDRFHPSDRGYALWADLIYGDFK